MHIVDLLEDKRGPTARRLALDPRRTGLLQAVEHLATDLIADMLPGIKSYPLAQPYHPRAEDENQHQYGKRQHQRRRRNILHDHAVKDPRQQPGLSDDQ
ncbi:Uncharacterised protein [Raoultella terrigena]|uniref:Uncharacterized protein n=1 Tax=Raoultella terrigena TaxID=577 RepID=A0A4U9D9K3_RAOTE|nr:Uncharacterised protein [Raoultella terrigena]